MRLQSSAMATAAQKVLVLLHNLDFEVFFHARSVFQEFVVSEWFLKTRQKSCCKILVGIEIEM